MARGPRPAPAGVKDKKAAIRSKREPRPDQPQVSAAPQAAQQVASGPRPPGWLKAGFGLEVWERLAPTLAMAKLLTVADVETFGRYCRNFARWLRLSDELDKGGETYISESQHGTLKRANPAFIMAERIERMLLATEDRFGLNPAERQRIMAARAQAPGSGDLFGASDKPPAAREDKSAREGDLASKPAAPADPIHSPIGMLN